MRALDTGDAEKIARRLEGLRGTVHGEVYRNAFEDAAGAIRILAKLARLTKIADNEELRADKCEPAIDIAERKVRLILSREGKMLAFVLTDPESAYDLAESILHCYDKIEGI